jgi:uncharacterized delta-60 repeat protein/CSLREA domain-containing protein
MTTRIVIRLMAAWLVVALGMCPIGVARAAPGDLDPTFDTDGRVTTDFGGSDYGRAVAIQPDGKIVVAGYASGDFALLRYNVDGSPDPTFGSGGKVTTDVAGSADKGYAVAIQPDGKIVVAGFSYVSGDYDFAVARYHGSDGSLDDTFGSGGTVTTDFDDHGDYGYGLAIQPDGKIVVVGFGYVDSQYDFAMARYDTYGNLDDTFGSDGKVTTDFGLSEWGSAVAIQPDGKIVVAGLTDLDGDDDFAVARYQGNDGSLDDAFGSGGKVTTDFAGDDDTAYAVTIQPDGKIVVAGESNVSGNNDFAVARYNGEDGSLDAAFDGDSGMPGYPGNGKVTTDFGGDDDTGNGVTIQPDGKIVAAGYAMLSGTSDFALARYNGEDGSLDTGFGTGGRVATTFGTDADEGTAVALQGTKIVVTGFTAVTAGSFPDVAVARYDSDAPPGTFVVNTIVDERDDSCSDGDCSLRDAMLLANAESGPNTINFLIPGAWGHTIQPASALPLLSDGETTIDGCSQPGAAEATATTSATLLIEIDGSSVASNNGFNITSADNLLKGLVINRFPLNGIAIGGSSATGNVIAGNHIGTDASGTIARGNINEGVYIALGAQNNTIGGDQPAERNVISGNGWDGVAIYGPNTTGNVVQGNFVGINASGTDALSNLYHGIYVYGSSHDNTVGPDNVISGNDGDGIRIFGTETMSNTVSGNYIGSDANGQADLGNGDYGVYIGGGAQNNTIGGDTDGERNVISGNDIYGVYLAGDGVAGNYLGGNYIGTKANGAESLSNFYVGAVIADGAQSNTIEQNVISSNDQGGIYVLGSNTTNNTVARNYIGVAADGTTALSNRGPGILIESAKDNVVGPNNIIAYSQMQGVQVSLDDAVRNTITQNSIFSSDMKGIELLTGAHGGIAAPVIVATTQGSVQITGTACPGCNVEVFENSDIDGEGETFIGEGTTNASGAFTVTVSSLSKPYLTATATDAVSGTSEFSAVFTATVPVYDYQVFLPVVLVDYP